MATTTSQPTEHRYTDRPALRGLPARGHRQHCPNAGARRRALAETLGAGSQFAWRPIQSNERKGLSRRQRDSFDGHRPAARIRRPKGG